MAQDAKQIPDTSARHDSEAPKSGLRIVKTQPGLGTRAVPRPASKPDLPRPPSAPPPSMPPAPVSRPGRAAVKPRARVESDTSTAPEAKLSSARLPSSPALSLPRKVPPPVRSTPAIAPPPRSAPIAPPPPSVPALRTPAPPDAPRASAAPSESAPPLREGLQPSPSSSHNFRSLTTTAQDWPIAPVALPVQSRGPTFGHRPPGANDAERFSLPAFLPPDGMQVAIHHAPTAANDGDDGDYAALDAAFSLRPTPAPEPLGRSLPPALVFAAGLVVGVIATLLLH